MYTNSYIRMLYGIRIRVTKSTWVVVETSGGQQNCGVKRKKRIKRDGATDSRTNEYLWASHGSILCLILPEDRLALIEMYKQNVNKRCPFLSSSSLFASFAKTRMRGETGKGKETERVKRKRRKARKKLTGSRIERVHARTYRYIIFPVCCAHRSSRARDTCFSHVLHARVRVRELERASRLSID